MNKYIWWSTLARAWGIISVGAICIEFIRPGYVDYLIPLWIPCVIAITSFIISCVYKKI